VASARSPRLDDCGWLVGEPDGHGDLVRDWLGRPDAGFSLLAVNPVVPGTGGAEIVAEPSPATAAAELTEAVAVLAVPGLVVVGVGDGDVVTGGVVVGGVVVGGVVLPAGDGVVLLELPGDGLPVPGSGPLTRLHFDAAEDAAAVPLAPAAAARLEDSGEAPSAAADRPPPAGELPPDCVSWEKNPLLDDMACGSVRMAKAPAATTKMAVPMAATGRSQPSRDRAWPGPAATGRKRSTTAQKTSATATKATSATAATRRAIAEYQAAIDANDSAGRMPIRSRIRSSPSPDGSTESAAARSSRRSTSS
jgi:hypothetical protein